MKKWFVGIVFGLFVYGCGAEKTETDSAQLSATDEILRLAFANKQSDFQVQGSGTVSRLLSDDNVGGRHQRFILELASKQTLLVSHNIDLAARIDTVAIADAVEFNGEYVWNAEGGIIHWTHDDPAAIHVNGWLKHKGVLYH